MSLSDDDFDLTESDIFLQDYLALLRHVHGGITDEQLEEADRMNEAATLAWLDTELE
jgi:hypothetical protein